MKLTETTADKAEPREKPYTLTDGHGLFLLVHPRGGKWWRQNYRFGGKRKTLALGVYPDISLADARMAREEARRLVRQGVDPANVKREAKARQRAERLADKSASRVRVVAALDGAVEIWKGAAVVHLSRDEAQGVRDLLIKLTREVCHAIDR